VPGSDERVAIREALQSEFCGACGASYASVLVRDMTPFVARGCRCPHGHHGWAFACPSCKTRVEIVSHGGAIDASPPFKTVWTRRQRG